ncbi:MAG: class I SAM-dependent methyltransferase [Desulfobacterales bacterium]|nr:class I SAM-dependent methyltransferase [Desulfobacterales bacterium]
MMLNRNITNHFNWILDNLIPPVMRDNKLLVRLCFWLLFGDKAKYFMEFKNKAPHLSQEEYKFYYNLLSDKHIKRKTDLNQQCIDRILSNIIGESTLDVGCGKGFLSMAMANRMNMRVVGIDLHIPEHLTQHSNPLFIEDNIEELPLKDSSFDNVVCTHTIEHLLNPEKTIKEIRRVAKKKIIIIVPRQREYRYTFDLHIHFFPYIFSLQKLMKNEYATCEIIGNDIYYEEWV